MNNEVSTDTNQSPESQVKVLVHLEPAPLDQVTPEEHGYVEARIETEMQSAVGSTDDQRVRTENQKAQNQDQFLAPRQEATEAVGFAPMSFLGAPPLMIGEDPELYDGLRTRVLAENKPQTVLEHILATHLVDKAWELQRYKRYATSSVNALASNTLSAVLHPLIPGDGDRVEDGHFIAAHSRKLARDWAAGKQNAVREVEKRLANAGLTFDAVMANAHAKAQPLVDYFDSKAANCLETLRDVQGDLSAFRAMSSFKARESAIQIENPTYQVIADQSAKAEGEGIDDKPTEDPR